MGGDFVFLRAHTGSFVHVQDTAVVAKWSDRGEWQRFVLQKKNGDGPVMPGDAIFLRAHTWRYIEVDGDAVRARWYEPGEWQSLIVEKSSSRRLSDAPKQTISV